MHVTVATTLVMNIKHSQHQPEGVFGLIAYQNFIVLSLVL
jgi:hypothetical protein